MDNMNCNRELIHFYLDGHLSPEEIKELKEHLKICPFCAEQLKLFQASKKALRSLPRAQPSPLFFPQMEIHLTKEQEKKAITKRLVRRRSFSGWVFAVPISSALLVALYFLFIFLAELKESWQTPIPQPRSKASTSEKENQPETHTAPLEKNLPGTKLSHAQKIFPQPPEKKEIPREEKPSNPSPGPKKPIVIPTPEPKVVQKEIPSPQEKPQPPEKKIPPISPEEEYKKLVAQYLASVSLEEKLEVLEKMEKVSFPAIFSFLQKVLQKEESPHLRRKAVLTLGALGTAKGVNLLLTGLKDSSWIVQDSVSDGLKKVPDQEGVRWITEKLLFHSHAQLRNLAIEALAFIGTVETPSQLLKAYSRESHPRLQAKILLALASLRAYDDIHFIQEKSTSSHWEIRQAVALAAGELEKEEFLPTLQKMLKDSNPSVRESAALSLGKFKDPKVIAFLTKALETKDLRLQGALISALQAITGNTYTSPKDWQNEKSNTSEKTREFPSFYGISLFYNRVVFLMDISDSMKVNLPLQKKMISQAIQNLPSQASFNILAFSNRVVYFSRNLVEASAWNKSEALHFLEKLKVHPQLTDLYKGLFSALEMQPDAIFLLSDGTSTTGKFYQYPEKILREVGETNLFAGVRIHTFGIFHATQEKFQSLLEKPIRGDGVTFMSHLARMNRGKFLHNY